MTQLIGFHIYQTENINIHDISYTIRFSVSNDQSEYALLVSNNTKQKETKYSFTKEVADNFMYYKGKELEAEVLKIIGQDIDKGII